MSTVSESSTRNFSPGGPNSSFQLHKPPAVITPGKICRPDVPILLQLVRQSALQASAHKEPNGNLRIKIANAGHADAGVSGIACGSRDVNAVDRAFTSAQRATNSGLVLNRIQPFHLLSNADRRRCGPERPVPA